MGEDHRLDETDVRCDAGGGQRRHGREQVGREEDRPQGGRVHAEPLVEPERHQALRDEPAGERIQGEQRGQPQHHPARPAQPKAATDPVIRPRWSRSSRWGLRLDPGTQAPGHGGHDQADHGVPRDHDAIGVHLRHAACEEALADQPGRQRAGRRGDVPHEVVPGEGRRSPAIRYDLGERCLLHGQERANLIAGRGDDPDHSGQDEQRQLVRDRKDRAGQEHEPAADHQDAPAAHPIGVRRQPQRDDRVAQEGQRQDDPDGQRVQAGRREVQDQDDREEAVAEHAQRAQGEQRAAIVTKPSQTRGEPRVSLAAICHIGQSSCDRGRRPLVRALARTARPCPSRAIACPWRAARPRQLPA